MRVLCFLWLAGVYGSNVPLDDSPMETIIFDGQFAFTRAYWHENERDNKSLTTVKYWWERKVSRPNIGALKINNLNEARELTIVMEYGKNQRELLQTEICFKDNTTSAQQRAIMTSVAAPGRSGANEGRVTVMASGNEPIHWSALESLPQGNVKAPAALATDKDGVTITRYLFATHDQEKAFFVRMCVQYKSLVEIAFSWGLGAYSASFWPCTPFVARDHVTDTKVMRFQPYLY